MTLEEILRKVQAELEISSDEIDWGDDETLARIDLCNLGIMYWAKVNNNRWNELANIEELDALVVGENELDLPRDLAILNGLKVGEMENIVNSASKAFYDGKGWYIKGNEKKGRALTLVEKLSSEDARVGKMATILYYKKPFLLSKPEDKPEMSDPSFLVDYVVSMIATDDDPNKYSVFSEKMMDKLNAMLDLNNNFNDSEKNGLDIVI